MAATKRLLRALLGAGGVVGLGLLGLKRSYQSKIDQETRKSPFHTDESALYHYFASRGYSYFAQTYIKMLRLQTLRLSTVQESTLLTILRSTDKSAFAQHFKAHLVSTPEELRAHVPLTTYKEYEPFVLRALEGDISAVAPPGSPPLQLVKSANSGKCFPLNASMQQHFAMRLPPVYFGVLRDWLPGAGGLQRTCRLLYPDTSRTATSQGIPVGESLGLP
jgi:hypothetical protein